MEQKALVHLLEIVFQVYLALRSCLEHAHGLIWERKNSGHVVRKIVRNHWNPTIDPANSFATGPVPASWFLSSFTTDLSYGTDWVSPVLLAVESGIGRRPDLFFFLINSLVGTNL